MMRKIALVALALAFTGAAQAAGPDPIETRQAGQDLLASDFAGISAVVALKGDVKTLQRPANAMARWMRQFPSQFPAGSETGHNTKALPTVWSDSAGFQKAADSMADAAQKLSQLAKADDVAGVTSQLKVIADSCDECHHSYRTR